MPEATWKQFVYARLSANIPGVDSGYHILTAGEGSENRLATKILEFCRRHCPNESIWFIVEGDNDRFIGLCGLVPDALKGNFPYAYDEMGRAITFVHGYFAPKSSKIPSIAELVEKQPRHLEEILRRANGGGKPVLAEPIRFNDSHISGTEWSQLAKQFQNGKCPHEGATFTREGKLFRMLENPAASLVAGEAEISGDTSAQKKTPASNKIPRQTFLKVSVVTLVAVMLVSAWKMINHWRDKVREKKETTHQNSR